MSTRRGQGEGSIFKRTETRPDGSTGERWVASVTLGRGPDGKRRRKTIYGATRKEVAEQLKILLRQQQQGMPIAFERQTVAQFLEHWLQHTVAPTNRPKTLKSYTDAARRYIMPVLGSIQLARLAPQDVERMITFWLDEGLSPRTVYHVRAVLGTALKHAVRRELIPRNVVALTDAPQFERYEAQVLSVEQARTLLDTARGNRLEALYRVALSLGLRQGEALALRWEDIDLEAQTLSVRHTLLDIDRTLREPKTKQSRRVLPLPQPLCRALRQHRARQLETRLVAGKQWQEQDLVFTTHTGGPLHRDNVVKSFKLLLGRAALPDMRFHDLRHSCASLLAAQGVPARVAMEILGHTDIRTTQNVYTHVYDASKQEALEAIADLLDEVDAG